MVFIELQRYMGVQLSKSENTHRYNILIDKWSKRKYDFLCGEILINSSGARISAEAIVRKWRHKVIMIIFHISEHLHRDK